MLLSLLLAACFSLDIADDFVRDARRVYALPEYSAYTNSLIGTGRYAGRRMGQACKARRPWREGSVKWIAAPQADNIRDIGGWNGLKTGLVFRGSEFDREKGREIVDPNNPDKRTYEGRFLTEEGLRVFREEMRIKTDLDLRNPKYHTVLGKNVKHIVKPVGAYDGIIASDVGRRYVADCLRVFADKDNYPVYVHCAGGADRTGTVMFFLEGLSDVSEIDLAIDYELTSFGGAGGYRQRFDHCYRYASLVRRLNQCPGATLPEKIRWYVKNELGLSNAEIAAIRRNLVQPLDCTNDIALGSGDGRLVLGLDGRIKPSGLPFVSVRLADGRMVDCVRVADDALGDLYFGFPDQIGEIVIGTEIGQNGLSFPLRSCSVKDAKVIMATGASDHL